MANLPAKPTKKYKDQLKEGQKKLVHNQVISRLDVSGSKAASQTWKSGAQKPVALINRCFHKPSKEERFCSCISVHRPFTPVATEALQVTPDIWT